MICRTIYLGFWRIHIAIENPHKNHYRLDYVDCEHSLIKNLSVWFLDGQKTKGGYQFGTTENALHFAWLFGIDEVNCWEIPF